MKNQSKRNLMRVLALMLAMLFVTLSFAACNNGDNEGNTTDAKDETTGSIPGETDPATDTTDGGEETTDGSEETTESIPDVMKDPEKAAKINELLNLKHELRVDENGDFKVLDLSDVQFEDPALNRETIDNIEKIVKREKPDLVIFNGDNSFAIKNVNDMKTYIKNMTIYLEEREIPWCHVYGNHDGETNAYWGSLTREEQQEIYEEFEYCVSKPGDEDLYGVGNFVLPVLEYDSDKIAFNVWCLDSGTARGVYADFPVYDPAIHGNDKTDKHISVNGNTFFAHYEPMQQNQVDWFVESSALLEEYNGAPIPGMMAFHIPLQETYTAWTSKEALNLEWKGEKRDPISAHAQDVPLFAAAKENNILAIVNSHDHINDFMVKYEGIRLCYTACIGNYQYHADDMLGGRVVKFNTADPTDVETYMSYVNERPEIDANSPILDLVINEDDTVSNKIVGRPTPTVVDYDGGFVKFIKDNDLDRRVISFGRENSYKEDEPSSINLDVTGLSNDFANGFAIEVMFKVNVGTFASNNVGIVDHEEGGGWGLNLYKSSDANKPVLKAEFAYGGTWNTIEYTVEVGEWYHAVMTYDGTSVSLYINGELVKTDTLSAAYRAPDFGSNCYVCIGACAQQWRGDGQGKATGKSGFMGDIADVNIYINPVTEAEIKAMYDVYADALS